MACVRISGCPLFKTFSMRAALRIWQATYCEGDFSRCERWRRAQAGEAVPANLLPNGRSMPSTLEALEGVRV
jgi:hypothetical protein